MSETPHHRDDFNPRSREGSDRQPLLYFPPMYNFNPRSREGSDVLLVGSRPEESYFNPRSREGSDHKKRNMLLRLQISIHAPAKGATTRFTYAYPPRPNFNPRSREGSDSDGTE